MTIAKYLGPGLLFAGAAVGVSHLVQSTRAGVEYGLSLVLFVVLINILKYPSFRFAIDFANTTGSSLVQGYRRLGWWLPYLYLALFAAAAPIFVAAVGLTTAAILLGIIGVDAPPQLTSIAILAVAVVFLWIGNYQWLEKTNKVFVAILTVSTVVATLAVIPRIEWSHDELMGITALQQLDVELLIFMVALAGFMPNPIDVSVAQSIWSIDSQEKSDSHPSLEEERAAFGVGYFGSAVLGVCFVLMGAGLSQGAGAGLASSSAGFANQTIGLFSSTLGQTLGMVAAVSALSVMITTVLTAIDVYGRSLSAAALSAFPESGPERARSAYRTVVVSVLVVSAIIQLTLYSNFRVFIDLATATAFITAPLIAVLNLLCVRLAARESGLKISATMYAIHITGVVVMSVMAVVYLLV